MNIGGINIVGFEDSSKGEACIEAINPANGEAIGPLFHKATVEELELAVTKAKAAFGKYKNTDAEAKAVFLENIALEIENCGQDLLDRYMAESGLPAGRAAGERGRTCGQLRMFAQYVREGSWVNAIIDTAMPDRQPLARPDLRSMERALGPIAVFGASNFPLAFSVAGGDTAAALAAGCPVVFKAHPSHLGTSEIVGKAIQSAAKNTGMPDGVFSLLHDNGISIGQALVQHPSIKAVAFTGSYRGGKAIFDLAMARPQPIPVYAEMGSTNPVFILPKSNAEKAEALAKSYVGSVTMGVGQFCTNPGLLIYEKNDSFKDFLSVEAAQSAPGIMLNNGIFTAYKKGVEHLETLAPTLSKGQAEESKAQTQLFHTDAATFLQNQALSEEVFGPSGVVIESNSKAEMLAIANALEGHLTATIIGSEEEISEYADLVEVLEGKVGRLLFNGFPTGVEVCHAMVHGGPFPATTDSRSTSVGTMAITRFTRPVCFQDMPHALLPAALKNGNPLGIWRKINGNIEK